jgi:prevent-host-death family protein
MATTKTTTLVKAREELTDMPGRVVYGGERIIVTKHGKPVFAIVPIDDLNRLEVLDMRESLADPRPGLSIEEVKAKFGVE